MRARCKSTRWLASVTPRKEHVSSALQPSTSRSVSTSRWPRGSAAIAAATRSRTLRAEQPLLRDAEAPVHNRRPGAGPARMVGREEVPGFGGAAPDDRGERHGASLAVRPAAGAVAQDREDPRAQRGAALEAVEPAQHAQPRLLDDLLRDGSARDPAARGADHRRPEAVDQLGESVLVTRPQPSKEALVGRVKGATRRLGHLGHAHAPASRSARLPAHERRVVELAYYDGLSQSQIARALATPLGTVKSRTFSALARLRELLEPAAAAGPLPPVRR